MAALRITSPLIAGLLGLLAAGCAADSKDQAPCPSVRVLADPSELTRFGDGPGRDPTDIVFEASFLRVVGKCRYDKDGGEIEVDLTVALDVRRGPANERGDARFRYFVALVHAGADTGPEPGIMKREPVAVEAEFVAGRAGLVQTDILELAIPRDDNESVQNYRLYLGFELTPEELAFNRRKFGR